MSRREFHFTEGNSKKFWAIEVEGKGFTVHFGRLGTMGQAQKKEFASEAEAGKAADKLIAEKTKKGYAEVQTAARAVPAAPVKAAPAAPKPKAEEAPAPAAPPQPAPARPAEVTRRIDLDPEDWFWATWRDLPPLPRPERAAATAFDLDRCLAELRGLQPTYHGTWNWNGLNLPRALSREEANFWFRVLIGLKDQGGPPVRDELARRLEEVDFSAPVAFEELLSRAVAVGSQPQIDLLFRVLGPLVTPAEACTILTHRSLWQTQWYWVSYVVRWFARQVRPYLSAAERQEIRDRVAATLDLGDWPAAFNQVPPPAFFLAALAGVHEPLRALVEGWPDNQYTAPDHWDACHQPQVIVFGLGDGRLVERHFRRLRLSLRSPDYVRAWLATTEYGGLDLVRDAVQSAPSKDEAEKLLGTLALVKAPEAAPYMLEQKFGSRAQKQASQWLEEEAANAVVGLAPVAAGRGKLAEAAVDFLRDAKRRGLSGLIEQGLQGLPADGAAKVRREVLEQAEKVYDELDSRTTPTWLAGAVAVTEGKSDRAPDWVAPERLPPLVVEGRRLNDGQVHAVLAALRKSGLGAPAALVTALRQHLDRRVLDAFAWRLFQMWQGAGAPSKEKWAMAALAHFGGDESVLKLTPILKVWPGEGQHARAVQGLEVLRAIGTDTALTQLNGIAQRLKFKGLQNKAREFMEAIAVDRGMTKEQLEDRIVPDLGLDEKGSRTLDFGPRHFQVVLGPDLAPLVRGEDGKTKSDLPKPGAKDDAAKAAEAVADWKVLKKALRDAVKVQAHRLEQAMVTGRRWSVEEFESLLVRHPLLINLVRRLLWAGHDQGGKPLRTFRVTDEREYADAQDAACSLEGVASVGVVHPLHLTAEERAAWGEVFGDYEIISPFPQLGRALHHLEAGEADQQTITRFARVKVPGVSVASTLEKAGWSRGYLHDHGDFHEYYKFFPGGGVTAIVRVDPGLWASNIADPTEQALPHCWFLPGQAVPHWWLREDFAKALPLGQVDPVVVSEVLADLVQVASRAK